MRGLIISLSAIILILQFSCSPKDKARRVDIDQLSDDGSTSDRFIFREKIQEENESKQKELRDEFR